MTSDPAWFENIAVFALLAVVPFVVVVSTSFAKIAVVLGIVRSALGAPGVPPVSVLTGIAVVATFFIMAPVGEQMVQEITLAEMAPASQAPSSRFARAIALYETASPPLLTFLKENTPDSETDYFRKLAGQEDGAETEVRVLLLAFASAELIEAFLIGFMLFLPFLLVDLISAHTLGALGMTNIPATSVALPLKLLLFIAADGWHLLINALVVSYGS